jgi:purine-nucleoside phosphorylase
MAHDRAAAEQAARFLLRNAASTPRVGLITGTGLGDSLGEMVWQAGVPYADIPCFPKATAVGHKGQALLGRWQGCNVLVFQGRFHLFEGHDPLAVSFPVRLLQAMGVQMLILTNAAGGLNPQWAAGDIMVIRDHLNLTGQNPLAGPNDDRWGPRFPDMSRVWCPDLAAAARGGPVDLRQGTYAGLAGPSLETPAEVRYLRTIGADAVGFSTVMEAIAAVHAGMRLLGLSVITNVHDPDHPRPTSVEEVIAAADRAQPKLARVLGHVLADRASNKADWGR